MEKIKVKHFRSGDVNLREIKKLPENVKEVKHNGSWVLAKGEATGSVHLLTLERTQDLQIFTDDNGRMYFKLMSEGKATHTRDHEPLTVAPGIYEQIGERELDHFSDSVERQVKD